MRLPDAVYFAARERTELEMAVAASSPAAADAHRDLAIGYRDRINVITLAARTMASSATACDVGDTAAHTVTNSLVQSPRSKADGDSQETTEMGSHCDIDERLDGRGMPVYVIVQNGIDVTSRWTRADADNELKRTINSLQRAVLAAG